MCHVLEDSSYEKLSQELRLASKHDRFNWLIGFYADKDDNEIILDRNLPFASSDYECSGDSIGIFANTDYKINDKIEVTAGLRYDRDNKEFEDNLDKSKNNDTSGSEISPKLTLKYKQNENFMTYGTIAKGYRSGGFHLYSPVPGYDNSFKEETLWNYEIGWKSSFIDNRVILNGAIYYMDIDDMQVKADLYKGVSYMSNAAKATSKGFELEAKVKATRSINFFSSFGYNVTEFDEFEDYYGNYKGKKNPYARRYNYCIGTQYRNFNGYYARAELNGYGKTYLDNMNKYSRKAYNLVNAKAGYETKHFDIYLYANNLFDKNYDSIGAYGGYFRIYSPPREVGVSLMFKF
jgi:iron complex outermembrane receptor protein